MGALRRGRLRVRGRVGGIVAERVVHTFPGHDPVRTRLLWVDVTDPRTAAGKPYQLTHSGYFSRRVDLAAMNAHELAQLHHDIGQELERIGR